MERGDADPGRDAYGLRGRRRLGERRAYRSGRGAEGPGAGGTNGENGPDTDEDDEYYGQLLRRPGDRPAYPRQPSRPRMRQPGRFPPPTGPYPPNGSPGYPPNVNPADRYPRRSNPADRYPPNGDAAAGGPVSGGPVSGGPVSGGPVSGGPVSGAPTGRGPVSGAAYGDAVTGGPRPGRNGRWLPPAADRPYRSPVPGSAGGNRGRRGPGQDPPGEMWRRPARPSAGPAGAPGRGGARGYGGTSGTRRETAVPGERPAGAVPSTGPSTGPSVASIAPDGLESFARDLRALRAKAELDYPELAERSHYTMKTLASAAGGLRLPTLPVAVAYVHACGGDLAEWEDRWQKLAGKITADGAKGAPSEGEEQQARPEPAAAASSAEPPVRPAAPDPDPGPGEVYVITSARPRQPGWPGGQGAG